MEAAHVLRRICSPFACSSKSYVDSWLFVQSCRQILLTRTLIPYRILQGSVPEASNPPSIHQTKALSVVLVKSA